ncbi:MAG: hypothetical protein P1U34_09575 [Coxiellaceae bacterium]|nr:hypothetical protein [Coxiellaceae bacterium]
MSRQAHRLFADNPADLAEEQVLGTVDRWYTQFQADEITLDPTEMDLLYREVTGFYDELVNLAARSDDLKARISLVLNVLEQYLEETGNITRIMPVSDLINKIDPPEFAAPVSVL